MFKELFLLAGRNKRRLQFIFLLMALMGAFKVIPLLILYLMVLELFSAILNLLNIFGLTICLAIVYLGINIYDHYLELFTIKSAYKTSYDIRMNLGNKLTKLSLGFFVKKPTGELNTTMSEYVSKTENFISYAAPFIFSYFVSALIMMILFLFLDWRLAFATGSMIPLALLAFVYADRIAERVTKSREESLRRTNSLIVEFIQGMPIIKIFNQTASKFRRFQEIIKDFQEKNIKAVISMTIPSMILLSFTSLSIAFLLPLGLYLYFQGSLTLSILLFFIIITPSFFNSLANYLYGYMHVKSSIGLAMAHILEVLNKKTIHEPEKDMELKNFNIEFENVFFRYDKEPVLKGIGFEIPEKSITAFVGPSGAGKTTIANLIARFWDIDSGVIRIGGQNIQELKLDRLLSYISIVFQEVILFNDTIMENIRLGRKDATYKEIISAAKAAKCDGFIKSLPNGYNTIIGERGVKLSEGEKQRISIARALLKNAPILLLDEATVFIDPENEKMIQSAVSELIKNKTVLIIAHRLSTITSADQILVLDRGRILEKGNHEELLAANNLYYRFWEAHKAARKWKI